MKNMSMVLRQEDCFETLGEAKTELRRLYAMQSHGLRDAQRFMRFARHVEGMKWADLCASLKPEDEKYVTLAGLREAIDNLESPTP